jgi:hypothetical protein
MIWHTRVAYLQAANDNLFGKIARLFSGIEDRPAPATFGNSWANDGFLPVAGVLLR